MKLVIAGGTGFMGRILVNYLPDNISIIVLTRTIPKQKDRADYILWDGQTLGEWTSCLDNADAVINLCGKSVNCRYNAKNKKEIYQSRLNSTGILGQAISTCKNPPKVWINASSATIYRHSLDKPMTEDSGEIGSGFSVDVCRKWESSFFDNKLLRTRQVAIRTAIVLGKNGGVIVPLVRLVKCGLGGKMGSGKQMFSWIYDEDFAKAILFILKNDHINGVINLSSPYPVTNGELMANLRKAVGIHFGLTGYKLLMELGAFIIRTETELIFKSRWVLPEKIVNAGFVFDYPKISNALDRIIKK